MPFRVIIDGTYAAVIPKFIKQLMNDEQQSRDFTYIENAIEANLKACLAPSEVAGQAFNVAYGGRDYLIDIYRGLCKALGKDIEPIFGPDRPGDIKQHATRVDRFNFINANERGIKMWQQGFKIIVADPRNIGRLCDLLGSMPNIDFPTAGGKVFWDTLIAEDGWCLQRNKLTSHCRILDPNNIRKAWGSESAMKEALGRLPNFQQQQLKHDDLKIEQHKNEGSETPKIEILEQIRLLGELAKDGHITEDEFEEKKKRLLSNI